MLFRSTGTNYVKRLEKLEAIASSFNGVDKSYAIQAGREVRVIVKPEQVDDAQALFLAKDIAKKIETELEYPGQIKVNVIREFRSVEFAKKNKNPVVYRLRGFAISIIPPIFL